MITNVLVKCGKPVLKFKYRTLKCIAVGVVSCCSITFLYSLNLFVRAVSIRTNLGVYIDMISNNGNVFPAVLSVPALMCIVVNIFVIYLTVAAFGGGKKAYHNTLLFSVVIVCLVTIFMFLFFCVLALTHGYSSHEAVHDGIISAMYNYSKDSFIKAKVDMMQIEYECCGSKNFSDWYDVRWYDANLLNTAIYPNIRGETPFSCCSIKSVYPCIHHGIEIPSNVYIYTKDTNISVSTDGCHTKVLSKKRKTGWVIVLRLMFLVVFESVICAGLRFLQTAHFERHAFDREDKVYTGWLIGCYAGKTKTLIPPPVPPLPPELMD